MEKWSMVLSLIISLVLGVMFAAAGTGLLGSFFGVFVGVFAGYSLLILLSHFFCLLLPRFGIGADPEAKTSDGGTSLRR